MATINKRKKSEPIFTHEGAKACKITPELQLRRTLMACMLWENTFYEDGEAISDRLIDIIPKVKADKCADLAKYARNQGKLRHASLLVARTMAKIDGHKSYVADVLEDIIQRPDELAEFLAIYWKDGRQPLSAQVKKGLARAFNKFDEYQLAKYNRDNDIKLKDVLFMCHAKPKDGIKGYTKESRKNGGRGRTLNKGELLFKNLVDGTLTVPDTWEVNLSAGEDKKTTFERLLKEKKMGALALLRNLRNMNDADVSENLIFKALETVKVDRVLPFRFIAAARYAPQWEAQLEQAMFRCVTDKPKFSGKTVVLVDVSVSMLDPLSGKSDMRCMDAACGVAMVLRELCDNVRIYTFSNALKLVPSRRGFALRDAIINSQRHGRTLLGASVKSLQTDKDFDSDAYYYDVDINGKNESYNRLVVITDEQVTRGDIPAPTGKGYMINVATNKNGVGYGPWTHIDGFSEAVIDYLREFENFDALR